DPHRHGGRVLADRPLELVGVEPADRDPEVETVEQRTRDPASIPFYRSRLTLACLYPIAGVSAGARVGGGDQLDASGKGHGHPPPSEGHRTLLERLAEGIESPGGE